MSRKLWIVAGIALLLSTSCTRTRMPAAQGQTHWWKSCDTNADCGEQTDLSCICSVCMAECAQSGDSCEVDGRQAECFGANASAVKAFCGASAPAAAPVCLEPCESECGDGYRCAGGACIPIEMSGGTAGSASTAGRGAAGGGSAGTGEHDGGQPEPSPATIELVNGSNAPVYAQTKECSGNPSWFRIGTTGTEISPFLYCAADCATNPTGPQGCAAICQAPQFSKLDPGGSIRFEWDGMYWENEPAGCANHVALVRGEPLQLTFCWMTKTPVESVPGFPEQPSPEDMTCGTLVARSGDQMLRFTISHLLDGL
jgi:hypothetical protein